MKRGTRGEFAGRGGKRGEEDKVGRGKRIVVGEKKGVREKEV